MTPIASTPETRRVALIARAEELAAAPRTGRETRANASAVVTLGRDATIGAIAAAVPRWSVQPDERCDGCGADVARVVAVGQEPGCDSATATLCRPCLLAALAALDAAP